MVTDVAVMRALAHPARLALLEHLRNAGPSTATACAEVVSLTPSATSYHLRALAKVGMVEEAPGHGDGRQRFWRSMVGSYELALGGDDDPETDTAKRELLESFVSWEEAKVRLYLTRLPDEPGDWQDAAYFMESTLLVTAEELARLRTELDAVLRPYTRRQRTDPPPGARSVSSLLRAFPMDPPLLD